MAFIGFNYLMAAKEMGFIVLICFDQYQQVSLARCNLENIITKCCFVFYYFLLLVILVFQSVKQTINSVLYVQTRQPCFSSYTGGRISGHYVSKIVAVPH